MTRKVRIAAIPTPHDYTVGFGPAEPEWRAHTLDDYLAEFGGWSGEVEDPFGLKHRVSMAPFAELPRTIYIKLRYEILSPDRADFGPGDDEAVVLKEYEVPDDLPYV